MDKAVDAFRTISEVAEDLDIAQHVLRFWETRFSQIKPLKRGGGRRYYRPEDVELLTGIRHLLYKEGYTIKGVQRILKDQGAKAVQAAGRPSEALQWSGPQPGALDADLPGLDPMPVRGPLVSPAAKPMPVTPEAPLMPQPAPRPPAPPKAGLASPSMPVLPELPPVEVMAPMDSAIPRQPMAMEATQMPDPLPPLSSLPPSPAPLPNVAPSEKAAAKPMMAPGQVSMFRGGLARPPAIEGSAVADPAPPSEAMPAEPLPVPSIAAPVMPIAAPTFRAMEGGRRETLHGALEELAACRVTILAALGREAIP